VTSFGRLSDPPANLVIVGARVIDPAAGTDLLRDVVVRDGLLADTASADAERIDGRGLVVAPGFCDLHVHLREPGASDAETIESGARAAAHGGFTTICAMPNTDPPIDDPELVARGTVEAASRVRQIGAATVTRAGMEAADLAGMVAAGAVGFSDDGAAIPGPEPARSVFAAAAALGVPVIEHPEDPSLAAGGVMRAGPTASRLGLRGWPPESEVSVVERDIALAEETGARLHLTHLSTAAALERVVEARGRGIRVTCDVTPHHLALTDAWVGGSRRFAWEEPAPPASSDVALAHDGRCRVNPPLASRDDALALLAGVADGTVDAIATDHAPHPPERKLVPFEEAAPGLIGLETALSLGLAAVEAGRLKLPGLVAALTSRPASIIGETRSLAPGASADLVLFDPAARWRVEPGVLASGSANTPLLGIELPGVVRLTLAAGRVTYRS
jgi:dihydroorotase